MFTGGKQANGIVADNFSLDANAEGQLFTPSHVLKLAHN
jgi:hypothetical protein